MKSKRAYTMSGRERNRGWKRKIQLLKVLNFAKRKKAGLKDDVYDLDGWGPTGDHEMKAFLTGYYGALDDLHKWIMGRYEEEDGKS